MTLDDFWDLIERARRQGSTKADIERWLYDELAHRPSDDIAAFYVHLSMMQKRINTYTMYAAFYNCFGVGSLERFGDFQAWLIIQGREIYEIIAAEPDYLIELSQVRRVLNRETAGSGDLSPEAYPYFGALRGVVYEAYTLSAGNNLESLYEIREAHGADFSIFDLEGEKWDADDTSELKVRLPRTYRYTMRRDRKFL